MGKLSGQSPFKKQFPLSFEERGIKQVRWVTNLVSKDKTKRAPVRRA